MLLITSALLIITSFLKNKARRVSYLDGFIMGIAQAFATLPGISRSGATIVTGLLLGIKKEEVAKFSFLMVLIPIIGANVLDLKEIASTGHSSVQLLPLMVGFGAAFFSGVLACKWMIALVKKSKLSYFGIYCLVIGLIAIIFS
jgi:undecaprenyl-diphosphatase